MSADANVNRISLEERIKALESGGSGGGGGGSIATVPGTTFNPKIIDQCADNAVTDIGIGYVFKLNIENLSDLQLIGGGQKAIRGFGVKSATFFPKIGGATLARSFWCAKLTGKERIPHHNYNLFTILQLQSFDASVFKNDVLTPMSTSSTQSIDYNVEIQLFYANEVYFALGSSAPFRADRWATNFSITIVINKQPTPTYIKLFADERRSAGSTLPAETFGASVENKDWFQPVSGIALPKISIGSSGQNWSTAGFTDFNTQNFPDRLKPLYPTSWYS